MPTLLCLLLCATIAAAQTIEGTVLNSVSGAGIQGIQVELRQSGNTAYSATTDAQGHFLIENIKSGPYAIRYTSPDYWPSDPALVMPHPIQITAGTPTNVSARMAPLPKLTVHVLDGRGDPVPNARVEVTGSGARFANATDAQGSFTVHQFMLLGPCTLSVVPPQALKPPDPDPDSDHTLRWTRTYYPGVSLPEAASKIALRPGEVWDIKLKLQAAPAHAIRGVLINPDGTPAQNLAVNLLEDYPLNVTSGPDGTFEFSTVEDGEWLLSTTPATDRPLRATQWVTVAGHDIEGVKLRLSPPFTLSGKVVRESPPVAPAPRPPQVVLITHVDRTARDNGVFRVAARSQPDADGTFTLENTYPGAYHIETEEKPPAPYYLDTIRIGDADVSNQEIDFPGPATITLVYKTNGGTVRGAVEKCASGAVWLIPQEPSRRGRNFLRYAACDAGDRYQITAVRPGGYYALAVARDNPVPWYVVLSDEGLLKRATGVTVNPGETTSADLPVTSH